MTVLQTTGLTKQYGAKLAVDHVSMNIEKGDIYGFVGENGAGKTTIIRLITGLIAPSEGSFSLFGVKNEDSGINQVRKQLSAVVEAPSVYLNMTAMDNLKTQCKILGLNPSELESYLKKVGLDDVISDKKKAKNFSLGMRQRLGIAMALIGDPQFIILDEPMNGLDPSGIIEMRELICRLNQEGVTFMISSHILDELSKVATKYGIISHGKLIRELSAEELHAEAKHSIELTVNDANGAAEALKKTFADIALEVKDAKTLSVYSEIAVGELVTAVTTNGFALENVFNKEENIEEFYMELIGGGRNA
ncbi:MAG: ATP-binding cassette domain-containing protein [Lachnospiraceae bacterium]|nr:ATP-binding cassette domain-containing protein [Lachnospiraceae bacterium]